MPWFQPHIVGWMELGGVYSLPGIRGGGEYGEDWQTAGETVHKQNCIDDNLAAGESLIKLGYTSSTGLVANGGSGSGVLPAAAIIQGPGLFAAALIDFPFLDLLRYHLFTSSGWTRSLGSSNHKEEYEVQRSYSPYHNIEKGKCYPPMLTVIGERDEATVPFHGYKFTAAMQNAQGCEKPALMQMVWGAGHNNYGATSEQRDETFANQIAFLAKVLRLDVSQLQAASTVGR